MTHLVTIDAKEGVYRRYWDRMRTHDVAFAEPLDKHWVEELRVNPTSFAGASNTSRCVKRRTPPASPLVTMNPEHA